MSQVLNMLGIGISLGSESASATGLWTLDAELGRWARNVELWTLGTVADWFRTELEPSF